MRWRIKYTGHAMLLGLCMNFHRCCISGLFVGVVIAGCTKQLGNDFAVDEEPANGGVAKTMTISSTAFKDGRSAACAGGFFGGRFLDPLPLALAAA